MIHRTLITALVLSLWFISPSHAKTSADVIVYGSTPAGYCAAIAAAREGASVILLEPTSHVGGMNTGGLSFSDSDQMYRKQLMGLFHEWHLRIQKDYQSRGVTLPYDVNVKNQSVWSYEAKVASNVTDEMLREAKVKVLTKCVLKSVKKSGPCITSIVTSQGTFSGREMAVLDASRIACSIESARFCFRYSSSEACSLKPANSCYAFTVKIMIGRVSIARCT